MSAITAVDRIVTKKMINDDQDPRGSPYNGLYGEAPPERGTFFRLKVYNRVAIPRAEV